MQKVATTLFAVILFFVGFSQQLKPAYQEVVSDFIYCIKYHKKDKLIDKISFPFNREYPLPTIKSSQEFLKRYNEVFDDSLTKMIVASKLAEDWAEVGLRGIMLFNGEVWLDLDGSLISVNYQSNIERKKREELIKKEKGELYESIREFDQPICVLETKQYRIRIDDLDKDNYRYTSWPLKSKMSDKPDIVIENGEYISEGSGGNHRYEFKRGNYIYDCAIIILGEDDSPPASLTIYKNTKEILTQEAKIIEN